MHNVFVTSFDANYFDISQVAVKSLATNCPMNTDIVCLVSKDILERQDEYVANINESHVNIEFRYLDAFSVIDKQELNTSAKHITPACNYRLYLATACHDYDRAIYFDPDTITLRSVLPILNYPMNSPIIAMQELTDMNVITFGSHDRPYFNNGVFITDLNFWREYDIEKRMLAWQERNGMTSCPEQDAMNAVLFEYWSPMPLSFNSFSWLLESNELINKTNSPLIVHFVGPDKPWNGTVGQYHDLWRDTFNHVNTLNG